MKKLRQQSKSQYLAHFVILLEMFRSKHDFINPYLR